MKRVTRYIVFVAKDIMGRPNELFDAVITHLIKREMDIAQRRKFLVAFLHADTDTEKLKVIDAWVEVRDVETFPFRKGYEEPFKDEVKSADTGDAGGISVDSGNPDGEADIGIAPDGSDTQPRPDDAGDGGGTDGRDEDAV